jgi:hypothetical protein
VTGLRYRPAMLRTLLLSVAVAALVAVAAAAPAGARSPHLKRCGTISFSGTPTKILVIRRTRCRTARRIAHRYDELRPLGGWRCALGHNGSTYRGHRVGFACGLGARRGSLERFPHAFIGAL